jgi:hypothetical protein
MMSRRSALERRLLAVADHLYRALLMLYPRAFRREFGPHMVQAFGDLCRQVERERGAMALLGLWAPLARDLAVSALQERLLEGVHMPRWSRWSHLSRSVVVRAGGAAALLGGALLLLSFLSHPQGVARAVVPGSVAGLILGMVGLHALLWRREGRLGALGFVLVGVGLVLGLIGMTGSALGVLDPNPIAPIINTGEHAGLVFIGAGMLLWGIVTLRMQALGRWSVMPLVIGLLSLTGIAVLNPDAFAAVEHSVMPLVFAASWIPLGYALLTRRIEASTVPSRVAAG